MRVRTLALLLYIPTVYLGCSGNDPPVNPPPAIVFETTTLASAVEGRAYSATIEASGGTEEGYRWTVSSGSLPAGLTLRTDGTPSTRINGTPQDTGAFTFTLQVSDSKSTTAEQTFTLDVAAAPPPLAIVTQEVPNGATAAAYSAELTASGGSEAGYMWRLVQGALPAGLSLAMEGTPSTTISGTIPRGAEGDYTFTISVRDSDGARVEQTYEMTVVDDVEPLVFVTADVPDGEESQSYAATIEARGGTGPYEWRLQGGTLPPGLELDTSATGTEITISGTPSQRGMFTFQIGIRDADGQNARKTYFMEVAPVPPQIRITTPELPPGEQGVPYSATLSAINGTAQGYTWSVVEGTLPAGLTLAPSGTPSTTISGTPSQFGTFTFRIQVADSRGNTDDDEYTLVVIERIIPITIVGGPEIVLPNAQGGEDYSAVLTAQNGFGSYNWVVAEGTLPPGLTLQIPGTPSTSIAGIAQALGTFTATVTVYDLNNATDSVRVRITVDPPATLPTIQTTSLQSAPICGPYGQNIVAVGGSNANYTWSVVGGQLPPGFTLGQTGTPATRISGGTGNQPGSYTFTVRVTDTFGLTDDQAYTIDVVDAPGGFRWVATVGDVQTESRNELYLSEVCGSSNPAPIDVTPQSPPSGASALSSAFTAGFSPSGTAFAYIGDMDVAGRDDVYVVDLRSGTPSAPINISAPLMFNGDRSAVDLRWSPEGSKLSFRADATVSGAEELFVVDLTDPANPGPVHRASPVFNDAATEVYVPDYHFSPDGTKIAYIGDHVSSDDRLFVVDLSLLSAGGPPGPPVSVFEPAGTFLDVNGDFQWTPDSRAIVYSADWAGESIDGMYWVDVSGPVIGTSIMLNPSLPLNGDCLYGSVNFPYAWSVSPDGTKVFSLCEAEIDNGRSLYVADISGLVPGPFQRSIALEPTPNFYAFSAKWSPDSSRILVAGDLRTDNADELYMVDVSGSLPATAWDISQTEQSTVFEQYTGTYHSFEWSPDGTRVAFISDREFDGALEVYLADVSSTPPSAPVRLHPSFGSVEDAYNLQFSPDGSKIAVFTIASSVYRLHVVDVSGATPGQWTLAHTQPTGTTGDLMTLTTTGWGGWYTWFWTADSTSLVFTGALGTNDVDEAWISNVSGPPPYVQQRISPNTASTTQEVFYIWAQGNYARPVYLRQ